MVNCENLVYIFKYSRSTEMDPGKSEEIQIFDELDILENFKIGKAGHVVHALNNPVESFTEEFIATQRLMTDSVSEITR